MYSEFKVGAQVRHTSNLYCGKIRFVGEIPELLVAKQKSSTTSAVPSKFAKFAQATANSSSTTSNNNNSENNNSENNNNINSEQKKIIWAGVEWFDEHGKNNGETPSGQRYFTCRHNHGSFIRIGTVSSSVEQNKPKFVVSETCSILPERSLVEVLIDRFTDDGDVNGSNSNNNKSAAPQPRKNPFYRDENQRFVNVVQIDCNAASHLKVVSSAGGQQLTNLFPNLHTVSVSSCLMQNWSDVFEIASLLSTSLTSLNCSDNCLIADTFPASSSSSRNSPNSPPFKSICNIHPICCMSSPNTDTDTNNNNNSNNNNKSIIISKTLTKLNVSNTNFPQKHFWNLFELFPNLKDLMCAHNRFDKFPDIEAEGNEETVFQRKKSFSQLESLVIAQNDFENLDSLFENIFKVISSSSSSSNNNNNNLEMKLNSINVSNNEQLVEFISEKVSKKVSSSPLLLPNLQTVMMRDMKSLGKWENFLQIFSAPISGKNVCDVSCSGSLVLHPESYSCSADDDDNNNMSLESKKHENSKKIDTMTMSIFDIEGELPERDARRLLIAMLPKHIVKLNNTFVEKQKTWFDSTAELKERTNRPEYNSCKKWTASLLSRVKNQILSPSSSSNANCNSNCKNNDNNNTFELPKRAEEILKEFEFEVEQEEAARQRVKKIGPRYIETLFNLQVETIFASPSELLDLIDNNFEDVIERAKEHRHVLFDNNNNINNNSNNSASATSSFEGKENNTNTNTTNNSSSSSSKTKNAMQGLLTIDIRMDVRSLENIYVEKYLNPKTYILPKIHQVEDNWVLVDTALSRYRGAIRKNQENEGQSQEYVTQRRLEVIKKIKEFFHSGSVMFFFVDEELSENDGAKSKGLHVKFAVRPTSVLHSHVKTLSEKDLLIAVVLN